VDEEDSAGGSFVLGELIDKYGEALYRDLLLFHQIDLYKIARKWSRNKDAGTSPRLLLYLIMRLPEDSDFAAENAGGPDHRGWNLQSYLLAAIANNIQTNTIVIGGVPKKDRDKFHMIEGPTHKAAKKKPTIGEFFSQVADATKLPAHLLKE
jgi:hypothetical protein